VILSDDPGPRHRRRPERLDREGRLRLGGHPLQLMATPRRKELS
jgi:hypothetical protein